MKIKRILLTTFTLVFTYFYSFAQVLSGYVKDKQTGEALVAATVAENSTGVGTITNNYGFFSLQLTTKKATLQVSSVGYKKQVVTVLSADNQNLLIELEPEDSFLNEVTVKATSNDQIPLNKLPIGVTAIPMKRLKAIPILFGEADILKALTLTPGVSNANEGTTGILVRGGTPDQNLILIDETPVYNISHLFGLVSVFNPDAIKNVTLYKSSFPARYGGRLSSVIDIVTKEGSSKKRNMEIGVGLINSRFLYESPLNRKAKNPINFFVSARTSNLSLLLLPSYFAYTSSSSGQYFNYNLYDLNLKLNKQFKDKSQAFFSTYTGNDVWYVKSKEGLNGLGKYSLKWGNITSSLRYINPLTQKLFFKGTAAYTQYHYGIGMKNFNRNKLTDYLDSRTVIQDLLLKASFEYYFNNKFEVVVGEDWTNHFYNPIKINTSYSFTNKENEQRITAQESGSYIETKTKLGSWLSLNLGARYALFSVTDTTFKSFEPRLSADLNLPSSFSLKMGYAAMRQYIHLISSNSAGLPNDLWIPATKNIPPQYSQQWSASLSKDFGNGYSASIEAYYKKYSNVIDYKNGKNFLTNTNEKYEDLIEKGGIGKTHGMELFVDKSQGRFTGWLAYTLAWNYRKFDAINRGEWYAANFDRRHNLAITGNYKISPSTDFSANWIFQSGAPTNVPIAAVKPITFDGGNYPTFVYGDRNSYRLPSYHRLDFSFNFKAETHRGNERMWTVGVYNAYNHKNPFYIDVKWGTNIKPDGTVTEWNNNVVKRSVIPFLPFVNYTLKIK